MSHRQRRSRGMGSRSVGQLLGGPVYWLQGGFQLGQVARSVLERAALKGKHGEPTWTLRFRVEWTCLYAHM